jgi:hypothetical protein
MNREKARKKLQNSQAYASMQRIADWMDRFYVDAIVGLAAPYGVGDLIMALFSLVYMYFSLFILHSIPLTLAIINNTLRDIAIGLIPFFIGDVLDFFHQSNRQNMRLIEGFVNGDRATIHEVNAKAVQSVVMIIVLIIIITLMLRMYYLIAHTVWGIFSSIGDVLYQLYLG